MNVEGFYLQIISCFVTIAIQLLSSVRGQLVYPTSKTLYLAQGNSLLLRCNVSETGDVWRFSSIATAAKERRFWPITNEGGRGFVITNEWHEIPSDKSQSQSTDLADGRVRQNTISHVISELRKESIDLADSGVYQCESVGHFTDFITIIVLDMYSEDYMLSNWTSDAEAVLSCYRPNETWQEKQNLTWQPNLSWQHGDAKLPRNTEKYTIKGNSIIIHKLGLDDIGIYTCSAKLDSGEIVHQVAQVYAPPYVRCERSIIVTEGYEANISCSIYGWPTPQVTWFREAEPITYDLRHRFKILNVTTEGSIRLIIDNTTVEDRMNYRCTAKNTVNGTLREHDASVLLRVKSRYATLWPFLGILAEVLVLVVIILCYEAQQREKKRNEEIENNIRRSNEEAKDNGSSARKRN